MKKTVISLILSILVLSIATAQNVDKVKGNRNVTLQQTYINSFHTIEVDEDFEVDIIYNKEASIEIEADENLHEFITFDVRDSILSFNKTKKITSKKKLRIRVNYDNNLNNIEVKENGEINSLTTLNLSNTTLKTSGNSRVGLTIKTDLFSFEGLDKSKIKLNLTADSTSVNLRGNSKLEALIYSPVLNCELYQKSNAILEGDSDNLLLTTDNNAQFSGKNFATKTCQLTSASSSDATLEITDSANISLSGSSSIYLYSNPQIIIDKFTDTSKIQKKVR